MYPDFYHLLRDWFGIEIPVLSLLKTFGFLVAISFLAAGYTLFLELRRKEKTGLITFTLATVTVGKPITPWGYLSSALIGFLVGYKLVGMFLNYKTAAPDPLNYITSSEGNLLSGIVMSLGALVLAYFNNKEETKQAFAQKQVRVLPSTKVGDFAVIAALGGFAGAKIFNAFETWDQFIQDPLGSLFSSSGLTFYGGLIVATFALWYYARKIKLDFRHLCDAAAPGLILAYAIGRLGCQVSGDGDWGIYNSAYITNDKHQVVRADIPFEETKLKFQDHLKRHFSKNDSIPSVSFVAPSFLPTWTVAYNYPGNVNNIGVVMKDVQDEYNSVLPIPVFPTPLYEFVMGSFIFLILWLIRKRLTVPLGVFSIYLILNGVERFLIEKIRVNSLIHVGGMKVTQAEIIAVCIVFVGLILFFLRKKINSWISPSNQINAVETRAN